MRERNIFDKITNIMLIPAFAILLLIILGVMGIFGVLSVEALRADGDMGGWVVFIMALLGIAIFLPFVCWGIRILIGIADMVCYYRKAMTAYRVLGIIFSVISILESLSSIIIVCYCYSDMAEYPEYIFIGGGISIVMLFGCLYSFIAVVLYVLGMVKASKMKKIANMQNGYRSE